MKRYRIAAGIILLVLLLFCGTSSKEYEKKSATSVDKIMEVFTYLLYTNGFTEQKIFVGEEWKQIGVRSEAEETMVERNGQEEMEKMAEEENKQKREEKEDFIQKETGGLEKEKQGEGIAFLEDEGDHNVLVQQLKKNKDTDFLLKNFYIVDSSTSIERSCFSVAQMLKRDFTIERKETPQILIYHTHGGTEYYKGEATDENSIVAVGAVLKKELEQYGYQVIHDTTRYDCINHKTDRNRAYTKALAGIKKQLGKNPGIQVLIDLHRDGGATTESKTTEIDGKAVAQFMLFNGLSRNQRGRISYLENSKLEGNLAFGLQVKLAAMEKYPELTVKNYLKAYRYNLHLRERSLLIELGNQNNSIQEAKNAMPYLAEVLSDVLQ